MDKSMLFWLFFILAILYCGYGTWREDAPGGRGWPLLLFLCIGILGWAVFGSAVK